MTKSVNFLTLLFVAMCELVNLSHAVKLRLRFGNTLSPTHIDSEVENVMASQPPPRFASITSDKLKKAESSDVILNSAIQTID